MRVVTALFILIVLVLVQTTFAQDKLPIPEDAAQRQAASLIANLFKSDYDAAKTPEQRADLAKKMLEVGIDSKDDATGRYVLFRIARDVAADAGDIQTAIASIEQLSNLYNVDGLAMQAEVLARVVKALRLPKEHQELGLRLQQSVRDAIAHDRFDVAKVIATTALDSARQARSAELVKQAVAQSKEIELLEVEFQKVMAAFETLKTSPTDPESNLLVGKYRCFVKRDWENGLLMLALGSDPKLKALAESEVAEKPVALDLGHAWWDYSDATDGNAQTAARLRAAVWYKQALPGLEGLSRKSVESRLALVDAASTVTTKTASKAKQLREKLAPDAVKIGDHYFKVIDKIGVTWTDAVKACQDAGGRLACLETQELQSKAFELKGGRLMWIGAYKDAKGAMVWLNGRPFVWWKNGKNQTPDNAPYVHMWRTITSGANASGNDGPSLSGKIVPVDGFICEWEE